MQIGAASATKKALTEEIQLVRAAAMERKVNINNRISDLKISEKAAQNEISALKTAQQILKDNIELAKKAKIEALKTSIVTGKQIGRAHV